LTPTATTRSIEARSATHSVIGVPSLMCSPSPVDPFQVLDRDSVGALVATAIDQGRAIRPDLKIGICGEHGGEPNSVEFCHLVGMNYVSCSPYRVPIARLAAAHAQINHPRN